jgi:anti-sigma regulatory factor (Ser/Thr protein kinase)
MLAEVSLDLPRAASASSIARTAVRSHFADHLPDDRLSDLSLLVTELVNNAVLHGEGAIRLKLQLDGSIIRGEVIDDGGGFEREVRQEGVDEIGGRGLVLVEKLTTTWGVHEGTTHIWFEMPTTHVWFEIEPAAADSPPTEPRLGEERRPPELGDAG